MFKFVVVVAFAIFASAAAKPGLIGAPLAYSHAHLAAPAVLAAVPAPVVTATSSQVVSRNFNGIAHAPIVAAPVAAPVARIAAPFAAPIGAPLAAPLAAAHVATPFAAPLAAASYVSPFGAPLAARYAVAPLAARYAAAPFAYNAPLVW